MSARTHEHRITRMGVARTGIARTGIATRRLARPLATLASAVTALLLVADAFPQVAGARPVMLRTNPRVDEIRLEIPAKPRIGLEGVKRG